MPVYHVEIRQASRMINRYNLSGPEIGALVIGWVQGTPIQLEDERWNPDEATLTIVEGAELAPGSLTVGLGWRNALRDGEDVTARVLSEARAAIADGSAGVGAAEAPPAPPAGSVPQAPPESAPGADQLALGVELGALLGHDPLRLLAAWREVAGRAQGLAPSESLALAERELSRGADPAP